MFSSKIFGTSRLVALGLGLAVLSSGHACAAEEKPDPSMLRTSETY
jgi:hypothetical protein